MYFIGVDSGGTKTSFVLADETGRILARHRSGSGGFLSNGIDKIEALLREGATALTTAVGITMDDVTHTALGFPGYGETDDSAAVLDELCSSIFGRGKTFVECDCYLGWAGSLAMEPGINIIAGTGANCYGVNAAGEAARASGWGAYCDEGSCRWIGGRLLQAFAKQADGREPRTALYHLFRERVGIVNDLHFIGPLNHVYGPDGSKTADLQRILKDIHAAGDPVAAQIYNDAARELWQAIATVASKLGMTGSAFRVSYSGGLFRSGACILEPLTALVEAGGGTLTAPRFEPDLGAVLIAIRQAIPTLDCTTFAFDE